MTDRMDEEAKLLSFDEVMNIASKAGCAMLIASLKTMGYAVVPINATERMIDAGMEHTGDPCWEEDVARAWVAMVGAWNSEVFRD